MAISRPSADTTRVCCTPGTLFTKLSSSQLKFAASVLIVVAFTVVFLRVVGLFVTSVGSGSGLSAVVLPCGSVPAADRALVGAAPLDAGPEAAQHRADVRRAALAVRDRAVGLRDRLRVPGVVCGVRRARRPRRGSRPPAGGSRTAGSARRAPRWRSPTARAAGSSSNSPPGRPRPAPADRRRTEQTGCVWPGARSRRVGRPARRTAARSGDLGRRRAPARLGRVLALRRAAREGQRHRPRTGPGDRCRRARPTGASGTATRPVRRQRARPARRDRRLACTPGASRCRVGSGAGGFIARERIRGSRRPRPLACPGRMSTTPTGSATGAAARARAPGSAARRRRRRRARPRRPAAARRRALARPAPARARACDGGLRLDRRLGHGLGLPARLGLASEARARLRGSGSTAGAGANSGGSPSTGPALDRAGSTGATGSARAGTSAAPGSARPGSRRGRRPRPRIVLDLVVTARRPAGREGLEDVAALGSRWSVSAPPARRRARPRARRRPRQLDRLRPATARRRPRARQRPRLTSATG